MTRRIQLLIGLGVSAFFVYLALPGLHFAAVGRALRNANYWWILPGVAIFFVGLWIRTWRWHFMLRHLKPVPTAELFPVVCIGYFGNNVYPLRAGEVLRSYVLRQRTGISFSSSLTTALIERIFDGLVMLLFVFLALPFAPAIPATYRNLVSALTVLLVAVSALFMWMAARPQRVQQLYGWVAASLLPSRVRKVSDGLYDKVMEGLQSLSSGRDVVMIFLTSVIIWLMETLKYWFVMHAFNFEVPFLVLMLMNGLVNLATTLPASPGYVGTFDVPGIETLVAFGVERNLAAGYTFTLHLALWLPVTLVGAYFFWRQHLRWSDIERIEEESRSA